MRFDDGNQVKCNYSEMRIRAGISIVVKRKVDKLYLELLGGGGGGGCSNE